MRTRPGHDAWLIGVLDASSTHARWFRTMTARPALSVHIHPVHKSADVFAIFPVADRVVRISDLPERIPARIASHLSQHGQGAYYTVEPFVLRPPISQATRFALGGPVTSAGDDIT